ncbi:MAG: DUF4157 domain-containing protein [Pseudomonadota bacterium]
MAAGKSTPGESVTSRLMSRSSRAPLQRRTMPGGGEVWEGPLATRALKALGARAMTVDSSIIVGDDFDPSTPESQALYAHERFHQEVSGGAGSHQGLDAEEHAARTVERMVLHRAASGGTEAGGAFSGAAIHDLPTSPDSGAEPGQGEVERAPDPSKGYEAMVSQGMSHAEIVDKLASACIGSMDALSAARHERGGDIKGGF